MIHAILIAYNNREQTRTRWERDVKPAVRLASERFGMDWRLTVVDNSDDGPAPDRYEFSAASDTPDRVDGARWPENNLNIRYLWTGQNLKYGPSINRAVRECPSAFVLYACTRHGRAFDPSWACDLIGPMVANPAVGITGCLWGSNSPEGVAHDCRAPWIAERYRFVREDGTGHVPQHIQGGVWAARTELLLRFPYPPEVDHLFTDHLITWAALKAGYQTLDVPSVRSVWRQNYDPNRMEGVKYLHDDAHT